MNPAKRARIPEVGRGRRLVWRCDNKLGSLRQSNSVWCVADWTGYAHFCLWYFGRGFSYARDFESLHAVCTVVESFHRGILSQFIGHLKETTLCYSSAR